MTREGPAISRARATILFTTLIFLSSVAGAQARPTFGTSDATAHAGDLVHFFVSGVEGDVRFELYVDGDEVWVDTTDVDVADAFPMPDLGDGTQTATIEARIWASRRRQTLWSKVDYLGPRLAAVAPADPPSASVPLAAAPQVVPSPAPFHSAGTPAPAYAERAKGSSKHRRQKHSRRRSAPKRRQVAHRVEPRRVARRAQSQHKSGAARTKKTHHSKRRPHGLSSFYDGIPGARTKGPAKLDRGAGLPPSAVLTMAPRPDSGGTAAIVVPASLGLVGLALAGPAVLRRRRLTSRAPRD